MRGSFILGRWACVSTSLLVLSCCTIAYTLLACLHIFISVTNKHKQQMEKQQFEDDVTEQMHKKMFDRCKEELCRVKLQLIQV